MSCCDESVGRDPEEGDVREGGGSNGVNGSGRSVGSGRVNDGDGGVVACKEKKER